MTVFLLFLGDIAALYAALLLALALRYGSNFYAEFLDAHFAPFTVIFILWLVVFYIAGLYDLRRLRNNLDFLKTLALSLVTNAILATLLFYLIPSFGIAPKTNLIVFLVIFAIVEVYWRRLWNRVTTQGDAPNRILLIGNGPAAKEIETTVAENKQLGYAVVARLSEEDAAAQGIIEKTARDHGANLIVVPHELKREAGIAPTLYGLFGQGASILDLDALYEIIMRKVPLADLKETWFLENIEGSARFYDQLKKALEFVGAIVIGLVLLPLELLIALLVRATSRGPVIYRQRRVGKNGREFTLYKFRTMRADAEKNGAQWAEKKDDRTTFIGRILRTTHLDELPQLVNIAKGELSFVGPRPERPEFVANLKSQIPFYEVRLLINPGVTGWAQINYRADLTAEDVEQKLQYDIYYLKNRSVVLDIAIILKTLKSIFINPK